VGTSLYVWCVYNLNVRVRDLHDVRQLAMVKRNVSRFQGSPGSAWWRCPRHHIFLLPRGSSKRGA
jgi:hypothetical protein